MFWHRSWHNLGPSGISILSALLLNISVYLGNTSKYDGSSQLSLLLKMASMPRCSLGSSTHVP